MRTKHDYGRIATEIFEWSVASVAVAIIVYNLLDMGAI